MGQIEKKTLSTYTYSVLVVKCNDVEKMHWAEFDIVAKKEGECCVAGVALLCTKDVLAGECVLFG